MTAAAHPNLSHIDLASSHILGMIYDDSSLTLEMDFYLLDDHPRFPPRSDGACYLTGCIRLGDIDDLRISSDKGASDKSSAGSKSGVINKAMIEDDYCLIRSNMGEIELTAKAIQITLD